MIDKICKNCEHYTGPREVKNGFLGVSVNAGYSDKAMCGHTNHKTSANCSCNCSLFKTWYALQNEIEKVKEEKERKRNEQREANARMQAEQRARVYNNANRETGAFVSSSVSVDHLEISPEEEKAARVQYIESQQSHIKKLKVIPIVFTILNVLLLIGGIVCKVIANQVLENNQSSSSYYAKQNIENAKTTSSLGTAMIIISIIVIVMSWAIWGYKYYKTKKLKL